MDKEALEARIKELEQAKEVHRANLNAHEGAILECKNWLSKLEEKI